MANLFDYLDWRGDISFDEVAFNKIDAQILALLSYSKFDDLVSEDFSKQMTFSNYNQVFKAAPDYKKRIKNPFLATKKSAELIERLSNTKRFKDCLLCGYKNQFSKENTEQFAAITFIINGTPVIAFRGTDDSIVGWREDFDLVWADQVPAQKDALEYFERAAQAFDSKFVILGHSKGGNLALNTAVKCKKMNQKRILQVYNFDGPGFSEQYFTSKDFLSIKDRIVTVYPEFDVVGMIFFHPQNYQIIKSDAFAAMQHDLLSWQVLGSDFEAAPKFNNKSQFFHKALNQWLARLDNDSRKRFVTALFDVLEASGAKSYLDIGDNVIPAAAKMLAKYSSFDKETKKEVRNILKVLKAVVKEDTNLAKLLNFNTIGLKKD